MHKKLKRETVLGSEATQKLSEALSFVAQAVGSTMGPGGRPFGFDKLSSDGRLTPSYSKDGLTVLRSLDFDQPLWQAVLQYCRQASSMSVIASGDGTTSTIVLADKVAQAIIKSGERFPQAFARRIEMDAERAIEAIKKEALKTDEAVRKVALTSTNGDEELVDVVLEAIKYSSALGTIIVDKNPASKERYAITRQDGYSNCFGYQYNQPFALSASENAASNKQIVWHKPDCVIFNGHLTVKEQIKSILEAWEGGGGNQPGRHLVIFAFEIYEEIANLLMVYNRKIAKEGRGVFVVKPRLTAEPHGQLNILRDLAAYCGVSDEHILDGGNYRDANSSFLGSCGQISIGPFSAAILGRNSSHWVEKRLMQNKSLMDESRDEFTRQVIAIRNAELAEGLVKVEVGGGQLPDLQERADRFDDASKAAQSCMLNGALPGAGVSYIRAGHLADVHPVLKEAFEAIKNNILHNYGEEAFSGWTPKQGDTFKIDSKDGIIQGNAVQLGVLDAAETIAAVIKNGCDLGIRIATMGGYSFRDLDAEVSYE